MTLLNQDVLVIKMKTSRSSQIAKDIFLSQSQFRPFFLVHDLSPDMTYHHILQMGSTWRVRLVEQNYLLWGSCCSFFSFPCNIFWPIIGLFVFSFLVIVLCIHSTIYCFWLHLCNLHFFLLAIHMSPN